ncbi:aminotransferase class I/II-fold pyridoxal phosphate-dependent enzyme [Chitinophaga flava]|uniref:Aminotransferase class I/II n=1 Tax=Chitinophaga flava TaxID=2259036 RepID=A0A365XXV5_9BACT|nr:aminotransferase class I/II-fold pyridoxal phosphate-dependent enzyme [Chitinophaga flava]RBL91163.1 aminotransferase class I/II [Chitinophaga flava]
MMDFTSSLYLAMKHPGTTLQHWKQLTTGIPAVLGEPALNKQVAEQIARLQGLECGLTAPSTLHLYWDLYHVLSRQPVIVFIDEHIYPVSRYGVEQLLVKKIPVFYFRHQDDEHLQQLIQRHCKGAKKPVVLCDGWCPICGQAAPVEHYAALLNNMDGHLFIDDTQAFGILGAGASTLFPYGMGGGGILRWKQLPAGHTRCITTIVSLAKAWGVPMAVIGSTRNHIRQLEQASAIRTYSSPVSNAHIQAAVSALHWNQTTGNQLRARLWNNVKLFRHRMAWADLNVNNSCFPVQHLHHPSPGITTAIYHQLKQWDIKTVLSATHTGIHPRLTLLFRSDHTREQIWHIAQELTRICRQLTNVKGILSPEL